MSKEAMKLALEALDNLMYWDNGKSDYDQARQAITALREALAEQPAQQEPVALKWQQAPVKTQWGDDMVVASVAIDKDHTVCLYCERDQTPKVDAMFALAEQPAQQDYERGFIDGMQRQAQSSVDKAVNAMSQRTWVGLTAREVELIDGMIEVQLHHAAQCDRIANRTMAEKQKGWDMERVELLRKLKEKNT